MSEENTQDRQDQNEARHTLAKQLLVAQVASCDGGERLTTAAAVKYSYDLADIMIAEGAKWPSQNETPYPTN